MRQDYERAFQYARAWVLQPDTTLPDPSTVIRTSCGIPVNDMRPRLADHNWSQEKELTDLREFSFYRTRNLLGDGFGSHMPAAALALVIRQLFDATDHGVQLPYGAQFEALEAILSNERGKGMGDIYPEWLVRTDARVIRNIRSALKHNLDNSAYTTWRERNMKALDRAAEIREQLFHKHLAALLPDTEYTAAKDLHVDILRHLYTDIWADGFNLYRRHLSVLQPVTFVHYSSAGAWRYSIAFSAKMAKVVAP